MKKVVISGMIGNGLEWYDFALYGMFAVIIGHLYFPSDNEVVSMMAVYGTFAAGFIMRPFGAILFGYIGDKWGRKVSLALSILLMALPTACIGILPTYADIGIAAPVLLTLIRLLQGLSLGGEFSGSITFLVEHSPVKKRGLIGSATIFSLAVGVLLGSIVATLCANMLPQDELEEWGWRVPFLIGIVIGLVGFYIRHYTEESPEFMEAQKHGKTSKRPVRDVFGQNYKELLIAIACYLTVTVPFYTMSVFVIGFLRKAKGFGMDETLFMNAIAMFVMMLTVPISGYLSDRIGRKKIMFCVTVAFLVLIYPIFWLLINSEGNMIYALTANVLLGAMVGLYGGPIPAFLVDLFPTRIRYTGIGLSYNISAALFGGTVPLVATWMINSTGYQSSPAFYLMACMLVTLFALKYYKDPVKESKPRKKAKAK